jgi:hypothetical protein
MLQQLQPGCAAYRFGPSLGGSYHPPKIMKAWQEIIPCFGGFGIGVELGTGRIVPPAVRPHVAPLEAGTRNRSTASPVEDSVRTSLGALLGERGFRTLAQIGRYLEELDDDEPGAIASSAADACHHAQHLASIRA